MVICPRIFEDQRGFFMESYNRAAFEACGIETGFVQDNHSKSSKGVLRGLHFQKAFPQGKLVRVISGAVYDVAVDLREKSPTYGKWFGIILSGENKRMMYIPKGFAHGFLTLEENTHFYYKATDYYHPEDDGGLRYDDLDLNIDWKAYMKDEGLIISEKDKKLPYLREI